MDSETQDDVLKILERVHRNIKHNSQLDETERKHLVESIDLAILKIRGDE